jgi:hypothetical protein
MRRRFPNLAGLRALWSCLLAWGLQAVLTGATARLELDREFMEDGEVIPMRIVVEDAVPSAIPSIPNSQILVFTESLGQEQRQQIVNGVSSFQVIIRYRGSLRGTGELRIPSISVPTSAGVLQTEPVTARVFATEPRNEPVTLHLYTARDTCYLGETLAFEIQIQSTLNLREATPHKMSFDGFVVGRTAPWIGSQVIRDGVVVGVSASRQAVTPTKEGDLILGPVSLEAVAEVGRRRARSLIDDFFGGGAELKRFALEAPGRPLKVLPLPAAGRPADFSGAVGRFRIEATVSRTNLNRGDAVTVRFLVQGNGSFDGLPSPKLLKSPGLQTYPGTNIFEPADPLGLTGTKVFEEAVVVDSTEVTSLEFQPFSFFDPQVGRYSTARLKPIPIQVVEPEATGDATTAEADPAKPPAPEAVRTPPQGAGGLQPLMSSAGSAISVESDLLDSEYFGLVLLVPFVGLGLFVGVRGLRRRRNRNQAPTRRHLAEMTLRDQQAALRRSAAAGNSKAFFDALSALLRQQVSLNLGLASGASLTAVDVVEPLREQGVSDESIENLMRLFAAADAARFAPMALPDELATWLEMTEGVVAELQSRTKETP